MKNIVDKAAKARGILETVQEVGEIPEYAALALWAAQTLLQEIEAQAGGAGKCQEQWHNGEWSTTRCHVCDGTWKNVLGKTSF